MVNSKPCHDIGSMLYQFPVVVIVVLVRVRLRIRLQVFSEVLGTDIFQEVSFYSLRATKMTQLFCMMIAKPLRDSKKARSPTF